MDVAIIIPARNEENRIGEVVRGAREFGTVFVIDDGSIDKTSDIARENGAQVFKLSKNKGKGYALRVGVKRAIEAEPKYLVFIDGDGQHRPKDIEKFLEALRKNDAVFGRRIGGEMPLIKKIGNWGLQSLFNVLFGKWFTDTQCGFRAFRTEVFDSLFWDNNGYFVDTEIAARISKMKLRVGRVDIPIIYHEIGKGTTVLDGILIAYEMLKLRFKI